MAASDFGRAGAWLLRVVYCTGGHHADRRLRCADDVGRFNTQKKREKWDRPKRTKYSQLDRRAPDSEAAALGPGHRSRTLVLQQRREIE